jgi:hypothetical protein
MGFPKNWTHLDRMSEIEYKKWLEGFSNEKDKKWSQKVQALRKDNGEETVCKWKIRGLQDLAEKKILQSFMCEPSPEVDETRIQLEGSEISKRKMRILHDGSKTPCTSHRRGHNQQCDGEHTDTLYLLSQISTRYGREAWVDGSWEDGTGRVSGKLKNRVDQIRCLGNAQVPLVAATAWRMLNDGE